MIVAEAMRGKKTPKWVRIVEPPRIHYMWIGEQEAETRQEIPASVDPESIITVKPDPLSNPVFRLLDERISDPRIDGALLQSLKQLKEACDESYTRECLWIEADTSLSGPRVARVLDYVAELRGRPASLITDNGPEFAGLALERWAHDRQVTHRFITPGKPS